MAESIGIAKFVSIAHTTNSPDESGLFVIYGANSTFASELLVPDAAPWWLSRLKRESGLTPKLSPQL